MSKEESVLRQILEELKEIKQIVKAEAQRGRAIRQLAHGLARQNVGPRGLTMLDRMLAEMGDTPQEGGEDDEDKTGR